MSQAEVNANLAGLFGFFTDFISAEHGQKVSICRVLTDRHGGNCDGLRDGARESDIQWSVHLGNAQFLSVPLKGAGRVFSGLLAVLALERWVSCAASKEVAESRFQMAKRLLHWNTGNIIEPSVFRRFLKRREHCRSVGVPDFFLALKPCIRSLAQHVVIGKTSTPERLGKVFFLLRSWVKPESVCAFNFHSCILQETPKLCKNYLIAFDISFFMRRRE